MTLEIPSRVTVLVRHDEPLLAKGIVAALRAHADFGLIEDAGWVDLAAIDVLVTDWRTGLRLASGGGAGSCAPSPRTRVLIVASQAREHAVDAVLRQGVLGLVLASCPVQELVEAVSALADGRPYVCADVARRMAAHCAGEPLTAREDDVLRLLARGLCNKTIARELGIAVGTVKSHVKAILSKLDASSRTEAASIAAEKGLVDVPEFRSRRASWMPPASEGFLPTRGAVHAMAA
ncbi:hypothetical protein CDN99_18195 [Roseateles aquatilis]|uniref:HTH luxR-type domain-containing protein n=1 Tax=Roseateles aquatilis TaxID=431061 RepID=A0A246J502_9BURK|nr:response regulator transcription factor [Roseateles aquatilis]OWQ87532.1 hypothetical protein CDN99_18195 [Roseateles aquatilis]